MNADTATPAASGGSSRSSMARPRCAERERAAIAHFGATERKRSRRRINAASSSGDCPSNRLISRSISSEAESRCLAARPTGSNRSANRPTNLATSARRAACDLALITRYPRVATDDYTVQSATTRLLGSHYRLLEDVAQVTEQATLRCIPPVYRHPLTNRPSVSPDSVLVGISARSVNF